MIAMIIITGAPSSPGAPSDVGIFQGSTSSADRYRDHSQDGLACSGKFYIFTRTLCLYNVPFIKHKFTLLR